MISPTSLHPEDSSFSPAAVKYPWAFPMTHRTELCPTKLFGSVVELGLKHLATGCCPNPLMNPVAATKLAEISIGRRSGGRRRFRYGAEQPQKSQCSQKTESELPPVPPGTTGKRVLGNNTAKSR